MGSGKTTLGKKLAQKLNLPFFDLDQLIEDQEGKSVSEIFEQNGENYFREKETEKLKESLTLSKGMVLALGGGTPVFNNNMDFINQKGATVYLKYNVGMLVSRLLNAKQQRPLLANKKTEELKSFVEELLATREPFYLKSHFVVEGKNIGINDVIEKLKLIC